MKALALAAASVLVVGQAAAAADLPAPEEGDAVLKDFRFASGESLPEVKLHYRTLGRPVRGAGGQVANAVLVLHGTGGSGAAFVGGRGRELFAAELFGP